VGERKKRKAKLEMRGRERAFRAKLKISSSALNARIVHMERAVIVELCLRKSEEEAAVCVSLIDIPPARHFH